MRDYELSGRGRAERWTLSPDDAESRSVWPTAESAKPIAAGSIGPHEVMAVNAVLAAYRHILTHPAGTEAAIRKLRTLRCAERHHAAAPVPRAACPSCADAGGVSSCNTCDKCAMCGVYGGHRDTCMSSPARMRRALEARQWPTS